MLELTREDKFCLMTVNVPINAVLPFDQCGNITLELIPLDLFSDQASGCVSQAT